MHLNNVESESETDKRQFAHITDTPLRDSLLAISINVWGKKKWHHAIKNILRDYNKYCFNKAVLADLIILSF